MRGECASLRGCPSALGLPQTAASASFELIGPLCSALTAKGSRPEAEDRPGKDGERTAQEKEKYQPSYETTILSEVSQRPPPVVGQGLSAWILGKVPV